MDYTRRDLDVALVDYSLEDASRVNTLVHGSLRAGNLHIRPISIEDSVSYDSNRLYADVYIIRAGELGGQYIRERIELAHKKDEHAVKEPAFIEAGGGLEQLAGQITSFLKARSQLKNG